MTYQRESSVCFNRLHHTKKRQNTYNMILWILLTSTTNQKFWIDNIAPPCFSGPAASRRPRRPFQPRQPTPTTTMSTTPRAEKSLTSSSKDALNTLKDFRLPSAGDGEKHPNTTATKVSNFCNISGYTFSGLSSLIF